MGSYYLLTQPAAKQRIIKPADAQQAALKPAHTSFCYCCHAGWASRRLDESLLMEGFSLSGGRVANGVWDS